MNRKEYTEARQLVRDNGNAALGWIRPEYADTFNHVQLAAMGQDKLANRQAMHSQDDANRDMYEALWYRKINILLTLSDDMFNEAAIRGIR